jgi:hypothetical protein
LLALAPAAQVAVGTGEQLRSDDPESYGGVIDVLAARAPDPAPVRATARLSSKTWRFGARDFLVMGDTGDLRRSLVQSCPAGETDVTPALGFGPDAHS